MDAQLSLKRAKDEYPACIYDYKTGFSLKLSEFSFLAAKKLLCHGVYHVDTYYYDQHVPLLSIVFLSKAKLKHFLENVKTVQTELGKVLSEAFAKSITVTDESSNQVKAEKVTLANYAHHATTWQQSKAFDFNHTLFDGKPTQNCRGDREDSEADLLDLQRELKPVVEWFSLGVQLEIPESDLLTIRKDHRDTVDCRLQMLLKWGQMEKRTWSKLVIALANIDRKFLADKLAKKYRLQTPAVKEKNDIEYDGSCDHQVCTKDSLSSEEKVLNLEDEVEKATQSRNAIRKALEINIDSSVPELQMKVDILSEDIKLLRFELDNKKSENQMLKEAKSNLDRKWSDVIEKSRRQNSERINFLTEELKKKGDELALTQKQLALKEKELSEKIEELYFKSARVIQLQNQLREISESFNTEREEMDLKLIEAKAHAHSCEKELKSQRDFAMEQVAEKSEEIKKHNKELSLKDVEITQLSKKIAEQEREMAKLREELGLCVAEQVEHSAIQMKKEDQQTQKQLSSLFVSTIQLKMEMKKAEEQQNQERTALEKAKKFFEKYKRILTTRGQVQTGEIGEIKISDQRMEGKTATLSQVKVKPFLLRRETATAETHPSVRSLIERIELRGCERAEQDISPAANTCLKLNWKTANSAPCEMKRARESNVAIDGVIVYMSPYGTSKVFAYNLTNDNWSQLVDLPTRECAITIVNNVLTTIGGRLNINGESTDCLFSLIIGEGDSKRWEERFPPMPTKQSRTRAMCSETHLIVVGELSKVVYVMNTASFQWSRVADLPKELALDTLIVCEDTIYLTAVGIILKCSKNELIQLTDTKGTEIWSNLGSPSFLRKCTYTSIHGQLVSVGGCDDSIRMYSPTTMKWEVIGHMETPRRDCLVAVVQNNLIIVGGHTTKSTIDTCTDKVEIATIVSC